MLITRYYASVSDPTDPISPMNPANPVNPANPANPYYGNDDSDDDKTVIKDKVEHHKGYDTHTIQRVPVHDPHAKYGNWFVGISLTLVFVIAIASLAHMAHADEKEQAQKDKNTMIGCKTIDA